MIYIYKRERETHAIVVLIEIEIVDFVQGVFTFSMVPVAMIWGFKNLGLRFDKIA